MRTRPILTKRWSAGSVIIPAITKQFPIHRLKIDRSFVSGLPGDRESSAIAQAIISLGRSLGLNVLAEGAETAAQDEHLRALSCNAAQGYLYAKPMPADECGRVLAAGL